MHDHHATFSIVRFPRVTPALLCLLRVPTN